MLAAKCSETKAQWRRRTESAVLRSVLQIRCSLLCYTGLEISGARYQSGILNLGSRSRSSKGLTRNVVEAVAHYPCIAALPFLISLLLLAVKHLSVYFDNCELREKMFRPQSEQRPRQRKHYLNCAAIFAIYNTMY